MSYQVLARKWRPKNFSELVGQEPIARMLSNAIDQQRLHHAYLFTGTRGVGKTTIARILGKCLNCLTGMTSKPCGNCAHCQAIDQGQFLDLYEVDAASRTKVEDTRDLLENITYGPTQGRFKIYLIDEVHMLSNHSFNALLKTLEEPPAHVKFLLATTDPKRLPVTILSRCLQFHLKRIPQAHISQHLQHICDQEQLSYEQTALDKLAYAADGSLRDALSLLDQAISFGQGKVNQADVQTMLGSLSQEDILPLLAALTKQDGAALFTAMQILHERAADFNQVLEEIIHCLHRIAIWQVTKITEVIDETLLELAKQLSPETVQVYYQMALLGRRDLAITPSPQQGFEMTLLRMLAFTLPQQNKHAITPQPVIAAEHTVNQKLATVPALSWRDLLSQLNLTGLAQVLASNCDMETLTETHLVLLVAKNHETMLNTNLKERITQAINQHFKKPMQVEFKLTNQDLATPSKLAQQNEVNKLQQAKTEILSDPKVKQLIDLYDANVDISLVS